jgi:hypothetical protein
MTTTQPHIEEPRKGRVQAVIETLADGLGNGIGFMADHWILFGIFAVLWAGFGVALVASQGSLDATWAWVRSLPWLVQALVWLLFLPVMAGMWVWQTTWPVLVRLVLVTGLAGWNLLILLPRAAAR